MRIDNGTQTCSGRATDTRGRGHEFESRQPCQPRILRKKCCDLDGDGRALAGGGLPRKKNFAIIFGFFRIFILPSVNLCRVLFRHSAKASLPINFLPSAALGKAFAECILGFAECRCRFPVVNIYNIQLVSLDRSLNLFL